MCVCACVCLCVCACMCKTSCQKLGELDLSRIDFVEKLCILRVVYIHECKVQTNHIFGQSNHHLVKVRSFG